MICKICLKEMKPNEPTTNMTESCKVHTECYENMELETIEYNKDLYNQTRPSF